jgi:hypothetical protein
MKHQRVVTEADFRQPEFRTAKVEDYEFDNAGRPVRKDRWETAIRSMLGAVGLSAREPFEVSQVVEAVRAMAKERDSWETEDLPEHSGLLDVKLSDGSMLVGVTYISQNHYPTWQHITLNIGPDSSLQVVAWRTSAPAAPHE